MDLDSLLKSNVPVVGKPAEAIIGNAQVVMRCLCRPDNQPFLIESVGVSKMCTGCGKAYFITAVSWSKASGEPNPAISIGMALVDTRPPS